MSGTDRPLKIPATGTVQYFHDPAHPNPYKAWLLIDPEIGPYYRWFLGVEGIKVRKPKFPPHISFVRKVQPTNLKAWGLHESKVIGFEYESWIYNDETYYWLNCFCPELEKIRQELGMPPYGLTTLSPDGAHTFHSTIANTKESK